MPIEPNSACVAALGAITAAIKAQHVLLNAGIAAEVISLSPTQTKKGCAFGVAFPCMMQNAARIALQAARIPVSQFIKQKDGTP